jgi:hypothetical protein
VDTALVSRRHCWRSERDGGCVNVLQNRLQDSCCAQQDIVVAESENCPTSHSEVCGAPLIGCELVLMVTAVYFDRDSVLIADEVRYERAEGLLALEVKSREPIGSQIIPKVTFGRG